MKVATKIKLQYYAAKALGWTTKNNHNVHIITYHSICSRPDKIGHLSLELFEKHLDFLSESGYKSFRVCDIVDNWPAILERFPAIIITFDDGLYNNYEIAFPLLKKYNMTATFFVPTSYIGDDRKPSNAEEMGSYKDMPMMSWQDLKKLVNAGFEIGAHSHSHLKVGQQEEQKALLEVELPKKILEDKLQTSVFSFAYPKGQYCSFSDLTRRLLMKSGYKAACTMLEGPLGKNADLMSLPRIGINGYDDINKFQMKLEGYFDCLRWLRVLRKKVL